MVVCSMTIATRNRCISGALVLSGFIVVAALISLVIIVTNGIDPEIWMTYRPPFSTTTLSAFRYSPYATVVAITVLPISGLVLLILILIYFEKTHTTEITFFAVFAFALTLESTRLLFPLYQELADKSFVATVVTRIVFFSRFLALMVLLAGAIFANGFLVQQIGPGLFLLAFFSFSLARAIPISTAMIQSTFIASTGYSTAITVVQQLLGILSILSYLVLGYTRSIKEYNHAALGILLILAGYYFMTQTDNWLILSISLALFCSGCWRYLISIHQQYLWQ